MCSNAFNLSYQELKVILHGCRVCISQLKQDITTFFTVLDKVKGWRYMSEQTWSESRLQISSCWHWRNRRYRAGAGSGSVRPTVLDGQSQHPFGGGLDTKRSTTGAGQLVRFIWKALCFMNRERRCSFATEKCHDHLNNLFQYKIL